MSLRDELKRLYLEREAELAAEWDRSLPFADGLFDRWERARRLGWGEGASVYNSAMVLGDVVVGEKTWVGPSAVLDGSGGALRIGGWCSISAGVQLYTHDTVAWALSKGLADQQVAPLSIGEGSYLGPLAVVRAGVTIGDMCVVGAGSYVNTDVPSRAVVAGSPARQVGHVVGDGADVRVVAGQNK